MRATRTRDGTVGGHLAVDRWRRNFHLFASVAVINHKVYVSLATRTGFPGYTGRISPPGPSFISLVRRCDGEPFRRPDIHPTRCTLPVMLFRPVITYQYLKITPASMAPFWCPKLCNTTSAQARNIPSAPSRLPGRIRTKEPKVKHIYHVVQFLDKTRSKPC